VLCHDKQRGGVEVQLFSHFISALEQISTIRYLETSYGNEKYVVVKKHFSQ